MRMRDTDKAAEGQMDGWLMFMSVTLSGEWQKSEWVCVNVWLTEWAKKFGLGLTYSKMTKIFNEYDINFNVKK